MGSEGLRPLFHLGAWYRKVQDRPAFSILLGTEIPPVGAKMPRIAPIEAESGWPASIAGLRSGNGRECETPAPAVRDARVTRKSHRPAAARCSRCAPPPAAPGRPPRGPRTSGPRPRWSWGRRPRRGSSPSRGSARRCGRDRSRSPRAAELRTPGRRAGSRTSASVPPRRSRAVRRCGSGRRTG